MKTYHSELKSLTILTFVKLMKLNILKYAFGVYPNMLAFRTRGKKQELISVAIIMITQFD